jgi:hypothetical protein
VVRHAFASALDTTFLIAAAFAVVGAALVFTLVRRPAPDPVEEQPEEVVAER